MAIKRVGRPTVREIHAGTERYLKFMSPSGSLPPEVQANFDRTRPPPKREYKRRTTPSQVPLEGDVSNAIADALRLHSKVLLAVRQNSGALRYQNAAGRSIPVWFYRWVKRPAKMRITDHWGLLTDGRLFAIETKRPGWRGPSDQREFEQLEFINNIKAAGGVGGFATSATEALAILP